MIEQQNVCVRAHAKPYQPLTYEQQDLSLIGWYLLSYNCCMAVCVCVYIYKDEKKMTLNVEKSFQYKQQTTRIYDGMYCITFGHKELILQQTINKDGKPKK